MASNDRFDHVNPLNGYPSPLRPTSNASVHSQNSSNPPFTPRATTHPEDSDSEYGAYPPIHTPISSTDDAPRYEDLPPTYEQVQAIALSEQESVLNRSGHLDARVHELDSSVQHMSLSGPNPHTASIQPGQGRNVSRDNIPVDDSAVGRGHDIPVYQLPSYESISGADHHSTTSHSTSSVDHRQNLLTRALEFTNNEPDADARFAPRLTRKIAVPPLTHALDVPTQFARTYSKALHAHFISPAEFAEFVDGLNIICTVEGFSPSTSDLFDTDDSLLAAYISGANEAFFAPRGLKVSVRSLRAVLTELGINGQSAELNEHLLKTITSIVGDAKAKIDVLNHATESLDFNVPEPASRTVTLRTWAQGLVAAEYLDASKPNADPPADTGRPVELQGSEPAPAFELPGSEPATRSNTTNSNNNNNNSWGAWGENFGQAMNKWGVDFGKRMEKWGEEFGNESAKRGMAFGENVNRRAEELGRRFGGEGSRGCRSRSGVGIPGPLFSPFGRAGGPFGGRGIGMGPGIGGCGINLGGPGAGPWGRGGWHHHRFAPHIAHTHAHPLRALHSHPHPHHHPFAAPPPARRDDDNESISSSSTISSSSSSSSSSLSSVPDPLTSHAAYLAKVQSITTHHNAQLTNLLSTTPIAEIEASRAKALREAADAHSTRCTAHARAQARRSVKREARTRMSALKSEYVALRRERKRVKGAGGRYGKGKGVGKVESREEKRRAREERREVKRGFKARRREIQMWKREALRGIGGVEKKDKAKGKGKRKSGEKDLERDAGRGDVGVEEVWLVVENLGE